MTRQDILGGLKNKIEIENLYISNIQGLPGPGAALGAGPGPTAPGPGNAGARGPGHALANFGPGKKN